MNENAKKLLGLIAGIVCLLILCKDCSCGCGSDSDSLSVGKYEYTDAVGHEYALVLHKDGTAALTMVSSPKSEIDEIAYRNQRAGVTGTWTRSCFLRGDGSMEYLDIYVGGENLMLCADGYIYNSFMSMKQGRQTDGNRWSN